MRSMIVCALVCVALVVAPSAYAYVPDPGAASWAAWDAAMTQHFFDTYVAAKFSAAELAAMRARGIVDYSTFLGKATMSEISRLGGLKPGQMVFQATAARDGIVAQGIHRQAAKALPWSKNLSFSTLGKMAGQLGVLLAAHEAGSWLSNQMFGYTIHGDGSQCALTDGSWFPTCAYHQDDHYLYRPPGWLGDGTDERPIFDYMDFTVPGEDAKVITRVYTPGPVDPLIAGTSAPPYPDSFSPYTSASSAYVHVLYSCISDPLGMFYVNNWGMYTSGLTHMVDVTTGTQLTLPVGIFVGPTGRNPSEQYFWYGYHSPPTQAQLDTVLGWMQSRYDLALGSGRIVVEEVGGAVPGVPSPMPPEGAMPSVLVIPGDVYDELSDPTADPVLADVVDAIVAPDTLPDPVETVTGVDEDQNHFTAHRAPVLAALQAEAANRWPFAGGVVLQRAWASAQEPSQDSMAWSVDFNPYSGIGGVPGSVPMFSDPVVGELNPAAWLEPVRPYRWVLVAGMVASVFGALYALLEPKVHV